jgi:hypothetical protein
MLRYRKIGALSGLRHHEMAANLSDDGPTSLSNALLASLPEMLASVPMYQVYKR